MLYTKVLTNVVGHPTHIQFTLIEQHELIHQDANKVITFPDMTNEQWQKEIQESPKAFCAHFEVVQIDHMAMIIDTPSNVKPEVIAVEIEKWFYKKYPAMVSM